ncbi:MAG: sulfotransferase, partial [Desulfatirhabdiaceae bacterium]
MPVSKPIIIFGTGRCGTTLFQHMFSEHPNLAWMSGLRHLCPDKPFLNRMLMKLLEYPLLERILKPAIHAGEYPAFWEHHSKGFSTPCRDLLATDVSVKMKHNILNAMSRLITRKRHTLLLKITGWPGIGFLSEIFHDAKFIHVIRDGRAVAYSLINAGFW